MKFRVTRARGGLAQRARYYRDPGWSNAGDSLRRYTGYYLSKLGSGPMPPLVKNGQVMSDSEMANPHVQVSFDLLRIEPQMWARLHTHFERRPIDVITDPDHIGILSLPRLAYTH